MVRETKKQAAAPKTTTVKSRGKRAGKKVKDPNEPKKPLSAYLLFSGDKREQVKKEHPDATFGKDFFLYNFFFFFALCFLYFLSMALLLFLFALHRDNIVFDVRVGIRLTVSGKCRKSGLAIGRCKNDSLIIH